MNPAFAATRRRLSNLRREWERLRAGKRMLARLHDAEADGETKAWVVNAALSAGVGGIYTGMEDILRGVLSAVDGFVPAGDRANQEVLDQASIGVDGVRPPVVCDAVYDALTRLRAFRNFERHDYRFRFDGEQVERNGKLIENLVPEFARDIETFIAAMSLSPGQPAPSHVPYGSGLP